MARDHRRLRVFQDAHHLVLAVYRHTNGFPRDEWFGLRMQLRRAAVSIPNNLVEGNARRSTADYVNFLNIARGSAGELSYLVDLSSELTFFNADATRDLRERCRIVTAELQALIQKMLLLGRAETAL